jgi:hypothetical protein
MPSARARPFTAQSASPPDGPAHLEQIARSWASRTSRLGPGIRKAPVGNLPFIECFGPAGAMLVGPPASSLVVRPAAGQGSGVASVYYSVKASDRPLGLVHEALHERVLLLRRPLLVEGLATRARRASREGSFAMSSRRCPSAVPAACRGARRAAPARTRRRSPRSNGRRDSRARRGCTR